MCRSGKFIGIDTSVWDSGACWGWELAVPEGVIAESGSESHLPPSRDLCARYFRLSLEPTIRSRLPSLPFHPLEPSHGGKLGHPGGTLFSIYRQGRPTAGHSRNCGPGPDPCAAYSQTSHLQSDSQEGCAVCRSLRQNGGMYVIAERASCIISSLPASYRTSLSGDSYSISLCSCITW